jgi:hypothetical protein
VSNEKEKSAVARLGVEERKRRRKKRKEKKRRKEIEKINYLFLEFVICNLH